DLNTLSSQPSTCVEAINPITMADDKGTRTPFGHAMRSHFLYDPSYLPLNHGSFGTYPKAVRNALHRWQDLSESRPDAFFRYHLGGYIDSARSAIARLLGVDSGECVFVSNATTGINTVLRSLVFEKGDAIVYFSTIYGACEKTVEYMTDTTPVESAKIEVTYPIGDDDLVAKFQNRVCQLKTEGKRARVAMFDTVSSLPGVRVPWEKLVEVCKAENTLSLVDGAHGVGHLDLKLGKVQPDFFVSNCHKWLYVPRGCAVFYVPERNHHLIRSTIPTSHGYEGLPKEGQEKLFNPFPTGRKSRFVEMFQFVGTTDISNYLCMEEALRFRDEVSGGEEKIMKYCESVANEGGHKAAEMFGTEVMNNAEKTLTKCCMTNVRLPLKLGDGEGEVKKTDAFQAVGWMAKTLVDQHDLFAPPYFHGGFFWVRFSGQIYVEVDDFVKAAKVLKGLCENIQKGEHLQRPAKL
ncbi:MAG: hypothetical protein Q9218_007268, partial [Villophora microphyllina]